MDSVATQLFDAAEKATPGWVRSLIQRAGGDLAADLAEERIQYLIDAVTTNILRELRELLTADPERQRGNPLAVFRRAVAPITALLSDLGVPPVQRDEFERRSFPDDMYGLSPATWADIGSDLVEPGVEWGAWKAAVIISRHRSPEVRDPSSDNRT